MKLTVIRDTGSAGFFLKYELSIDGLVVGKIARKETLTFEVGSGHHVLSAKIKLVDPTFEFDGDAGDKTVRMVYNQTTFKELYAFNPLKAAGKAIDNVSKAFDGKTLSGKKIIDFVED